MPLFLIVIILYAAYFYLLMRWNIHQGAWAYIGAIVGVPILIVAAAYVLQIMGLYMDLSGDPGECAKWDWASGECRDKMGP